jgi:hypothetical protein
MLINFCFFLRKNGALRGRNGTMHCPVREGSGQRSGREGETSPAFFMKISKNFGLGRVVYGKIVV